MSAQTLMALVVFAGLGGSIWLFVVACAGLAPAPGRGYVRARLGPVLTPRTGSAVAVGTAVAVLTRWPVAALAAAALTWWWPRLFGGAAAAQSAIARLEALAGWTESLKDTVAGAVGLEEAIPASAAAAGEPIRAQVTGLAERLRGREAMPDALAAFAVDLDDPSADLVVAALILNARLRGPGLRATLEALAVSTREELDMRRRVEAGRRALRTGVKIITGITVAFLGALALLSSSYLDPYDTPLGQLVLLVVASVFAAAFAWLRALSDISVPERILTRADTLAVPRKGAGR